MSALTPFSFSIEMPKLYRPLYYDPLTSQDEICLSSRIFLNDLDTSARLEHLIIEQEDKLCQNYWRDGKITWKFEYKSTFFHLLKRNGIKWRESSPLGVLNYDYYLKTREIEELLTFEGTKQEAQIWGMMLLNDNLYNTSPWNIWFLMDEE